MEIIQYPFKLTPKTKIKESFMKHIISKHGCIEVFQAVEKAFETINQLRDQFDFEKVNTCDIKKCEELESTIYIYLKYAQHLQKKFKFEKWQQERVNISFCWSDSFRKEEATTTSNLRVEMCSILYNLVVLLYYIGSEYLKQNSPESRKNALKKFRYSLWAINEVKRNLPSVFKEFDKPHLDFTVPNLVVFENVLYGLCYICLYQNLEPQELQLGIQHVAGITGEANKHFQHALKITSEVCNDVNTPFSQVFLLETKKYLYSNTVYYFCISAFKMAMYHQSLVEMEPSVFHMGQAIAYLLKALNILQVTFKNIDNLLPLMKEKITLLMSKIHTKYQEFTQINQQFYNNPVINFQDLKATSLQDKAKVTFIIPPDLEKELPEETVFRDLLSPDTISLLKDVKKFAEGNQQTISNDLQDLKEARNQQYQQNFVNGYLEMLHEYAYLQRKKEEKAMNQNNQAFMIADQRRQIPYTIQQKIDEIQSIGGEQKIRNLIFVLEENFLNAQALLHESLQKLKQEMKEDYEHRCTFKEKSQLPPSSQANVEYYKQIDAYQIELQENLRDAKQLDSESRQSFDDLGYYFQMIRKEPEYILSKIPEANDQEFALSFLEKIQELYRYDNEVVALIKQAEIQIPEITNCLQSIGMAQILDESRKRKLNKEKTIQYILSISDNIFKNLEANISKANNFLDSICKISSFLNSQKIDSEAQNSIKEIEKINYGLSKIIELYCELKQGLDFYQALIDKSVEQDTAIESFVTSRSILRQNEASILKDQENGHNHVNGVTAQPFFQDGSFPMGESRYIEPKSFIGQSSEIDKY